MAGYSWMCLGCQALHLGVTAMPLPVKTETTKIPMCDCLLTSPTSPSKHRLLTKLLLQLFRTCTCSNNVFNVMGQCPNLNSSNKIIQQEAHVDCACSPLSVDVCPQLEKLQEPGSSGSQKQWTSASDLRSRTVWQGP